MAAIWEAIRQIQLKLDEHDESIDNFGELLAKTVTEEELRDLLHRVKGALNSLED